jgi:hypothetical protein
MAASSLAITIGNQMRITRKTVADRLDSGRNAEALKQKGQTAWDDVPRAQASSTGGTLNHSFAPL